MTEKISSSLRESKTARWTVLVLVSFTMMCMYYLTEEQYICVAQDKKIPWDEREVVRQELAILWPPKAAEISLNENPA